MKTTKKLDEEIKSDFDNSEIKKILSNYDSLIKKSIVWFCIFIIVGGVFFLGGVTSCIRSGLAPSNPIYALKCVVPKNFSDKKTERLNNILDLGDDFEISARLYNKTT